MIKGVGRIIYLYGKKNKKCNNRFFVDLKKINFCSNTEGNSIHHGSSNSSSAPKKISPLFHLFHTNIKPYSTRAINGLVKETKKSNINFEHIIRILKSLKREYENYDEKKNLEGKVNFLLPHIFEESERNYIHFACILHNFHKLRKKISNKYKIKVYNRFNNIFLNNINLFTLKELTIILKCLSEEKLINSEKIVHFCIFKFIYFLTLDILHKKKKKNDVLLYNFLFLLSYNYKECVKDFFILSIDTINTNVDMHYFYDLICNLSDEDKKGQMLYFKNKFSKYEYNSFNLHDLSTFMFFLKSYPLNIRSLSMYTFLLHLYLSLNFLESIITTSFHEHLENNFLRFEKKKKFEFLEKKAPRELRSEGIVKVEQNKDVQKEADTDAEVDVETEAEEKVDVETEADEEAKVEQGSRCNGGENKVGHFKMDSASAAKDEIIDHISDLIVKGGEASSSPSTTFPAVLKKKDDRKKNKCIKENVHSMSIIIYVSIKRKWKNKFLYILSNYLLLKYINFINLFDLCNIFDLIIFDTKISRKNFDILFERIKYLVSKETNSKTFAIFCISIMRHKEDLKNHFNDIIISIYKIILNKKKCEKLFYRENTVILANITNFLEDQKISSLFYLYYLTKFTNFLKFLILQNKTNNHNLFLSVIDTYDILRTFINIFKIFQKNKYFHLSQKKKKVFINFNLLLSCMLYFLKYVCFKNITAQDNCLLNNSSLTTMNDLKKIKILNRTCYLLNLLLHLIKKMRMDNIIEDSNAQLSYEIFSYFKNSIYKNYQHILFSSGNSNKNHVNHILSFIFIISNGSYIK
ncbi:hypothetical protein MKS88_003768 [Plasmodium brasilianum]|uniref:Uncharacterized protein n=2 Tax=Plasmodium (Plasmodium) TaxID=418103 RepID=A0A1D3SMU2_PLAMA|nr:conserved Plasmodium protein, unknown function [Plasmodium malariae]KAI4837298.1 hypothetical protein MKS88_003768 [Plasmodium brasilianum]SCO93180.1 conserved Plasmodium protein, unknown function [Plasmodium malariae]